MCMQLMIAEVDVAECATADELRDHIGNGDASQKRMYLNAPSRQTQAPYQRSGCS